MGKLMSKSIRSGSFGSRLLELREIRNLSQKAVSILAGMDQSYVAGLEAGRRPPPREKQLARLIYALQATKTEERELREAHVFSRLVDAVEEINPERGQALVALAHQLCNLSLDDLKHIEGMTSRLRHQSVNSTTRGHMT
jgi:transcriptional regulator with XRE-family HTH domain